MNESSPLSLLRQAPPHLILDTIQRLKRQRAADAEQERVRADADAIRSRCTTLIGFMREAWHVLHPRTDFVEGWVNAALCDHLEAITFGRFLALGLPNRLRENVPPGMTKSLTVGVMWQAWEWGPCDLAHMQFMGTSYEASLAVRDSEKTRNLIQSDWYQTLWGAKAEGIYRDRVVLKKLAADDWSNTRGGYRKAVAFNSLTGGRADRLLIDDPLSVAQSKSDADREHAKFIMRESVPSRVNDPVKSATVMIMQRVHTDDPSGLWEQLKVPHVALVLPMRFERARRCVTPIFTDPRQQEGELLHPARMPMKELDATEREMTAYAVSGQHQQLPVPREGGMFKRSWFKPADRLPQGYRWVRHWDLADTEATYGADPPYTAGVLLGKHPTLSQYCVAHVARCREQSPEVRKLVLTTAASDLATCRQAGGSYEIQVPQDPGSAGKTVARDMLSMLDGYVASKLVETGSKIDRAEPMATQAENGNVSILVGPWNDAFLEEVSNFPGTKFKDQTDSMSGGYARLQKKPRFTPGGAGPPVLAIFGR